MWYMLIDIVTMTVIGYYPTPEQCDLAGYVWTISATVSETWCVQVDMA